jgi:hypothetical protein
MSVIGPFSAGVLLIYNPANPQQVRHVSGSGSPQWVVLGSVPDTEVLASLAQLGSSGKYYAAADGAIDISQIYAFELYPPGTTVIAGTNPIDAGTLTIGGSLADIIRAQATAAIATAFSGDGAQAIMEAFTQAIVDTDVTYEQLAASLIGFLNGANQIVDNNDGTLTITVLNRQGSTAFIVRPNKATGAVAVKGSFG